MQKFITTSKLKKTRFHTTFKKTRLAFTKHKSIIKNSFIKETLILTNTNENFFSKNNFNSVTKNVLLDTFGRFHNYLRISLTERCNLRCEYCMPERGIDLTPKSKLLTFTEMEYLIKLFRRAGVNKVRLTGGEPTIRNDLVEIIKMIKTNGIHTIGMTTNGISLKNKLAILKDAGLTNLNISLDTLIEAKFELLTKRRGHSKVLDTIETALRMGYPLKINCVIIKGRNDDEIFDFLEITQKKALDIRFIEYMPFDDNKWSFKKMIPNSVLLDLISAKYGEEKIIKLKDEINQPSKSYQIHGYQGKFGFISSMSNHFCATCNRLRITADGNLKVCLFGREEWSLRDMIRAGASENEIYHLINSAVKKKRFSHDGMFEIDKNNKIINKKNRPMIKIGG